MKRHATSATIRRFERALRRARLYLDAQQPQQAPRADGPRETVSASPAEPQGDDAGRAIIPVAEHALQTERSSQVMGYFLVTIGALAVSERVASEALLTMDGTAAPWALLAGAILCYLVGQTDRDYSTSLVATGFSAASFGMSRLLTTAMGLSTHVAVMIALSLYAIYCLGAAGPRDLTFAIAKAHLPMLVNFILTVMIGFPLASLCYAYLG